MFLIFPVANRIELPLVYQAHCYNRFIRLQLAGKVSCRHGRTAGISQQPSYSGSAKEALNKWLRGRIAALRGARPLAYLSDMSRVLRSVRLALHPARSFIQRFPNLHKWTE